MNIIFFPHHHHSHVILYTHIYNQWAKMEQKQNSQNGHPPPRVGTTGENDTGHPMVTGLQPFCSPAQQMLKNPPIVEDGGLICSLKQLLHRSLSGLLNSSLEGSSYLMTFPGISKNEHQGYMPTLGAIKLSHLTSYSQKVGATRNILRRNTKRLFCCKSMICLYIYIYICLKNQKISDQYTSPQFHVPIIMPEVLSEVYLVSQKSYSQSLSLSTQ